MIEADAGKRASQGFNRLLEELRPDLVRFAFWLARDRQVAEDVVQETLIRAWRAQTDLKDTGAVKSWLFTIARREHARLYERKRLPTVELDELVTAESAELAEQPDGEWHDLRQAILGLAEEYREPLVMQVLGGFSTQEIADEMGLTQQAVLTRLFRARHQLRDAYAASEEATDR
ncbi:MAG TPA: sigma-70 family RNA polymerase sigma factor [Steroidobacteraceae bacterium]|nr:sigma-70 family RNA polymerase sigma factor [Steroidobacteraceae bacterium]HRX88546.1 sigma-70 family RNA polymerase sigma factor [Steroidobacteraceae bacterium]